MRIGVRRHYCLVSSTLSLRRKRSSSAPSLPGRRRISPRVAFACQGGPACWCRRTTGFSKIRDANSFELLDPVGPEAVANGAICAEPGDGRPLDVDIGFVREFGR